MLNNEDEVIIMMMIEMRVDYKEDHLTRISSSRSWYYKCWRNRTRSSAALKIDDIFCAKKEDFLAQKKIENTLHTCL